MSLKKWLSNVISKSNKNKSNSKNNQTRKLTLEALEDRVVPTTTLFLDFGQNFPDGGLLTTVGEFLDIDEVRDASNQVVMTGPDLTDAIYGNLPTTEQIRLIGPETLVKDPVTNQVGESQEEKITISITEVQEAGGPMGRHILQPFDIEVKETSAQSFNQVRNRLRQNDLDSDPEKSGNQNGSEYDGFGENDAYVIVGQVNRASTGTSIASGTQVLGTQGGTDHLRQTPTNLLDEVGIVFLDEHVNTIPYSSTFKEFLVHEVASTIVHEALHTFGLNHTINKPNTHEFESILALGDQVVTGSPNGNAITRQMVTRFELTDHHDVGNIVHNYNQIANDPDIGLRDANRNNIPDLAYITGTGGADKITVTAAGVDNAGRTKLTIEVTAYKDFVGDNTFKKADPVTIVVGKDTEGVIRIDAGPGDDEIFVEDTVTTTVLIYGGAGSDIIISGSGNDIIYGQEGDDIISGEAGADVIYGGADDDLIDGADGNDTLSGNAGDDKLEGGDGSDKVMGGEGDDELLGDSFDLQEGVNATDYLLGGPGQDTLNGGPGQDIIFNLTQQDSNVSDGADLVLDDNVLIKPLAPPNISDIDKGSVTQSASNLASDQVSVLRNGIDDFVQVIASINTNLPVGDEKVGTLVSDAISRGLSLQVGDYFDSTGQPTVEGLLATLQAVDQVGDLQVAISIPSEPTTANGIRFEVQFHAKRTTTTTLRNLGAHALNIVGAPSADSTVPLEAYVEVNVVFGVDSGGSFYVELPDNQVTLQTKIQDTNINMPMSLGLIGGEIENGIVTYDGKLTINLDHEDGTRLIPSNVFNEDMTIDMTGSFAAELPFEVQLPGYTDSGVVTVVQSDLSQIDGTSVEIQGSEILDRLSNVNIGDFKQWLEELTQWLEFTNSFEGLDIKLPFASNTSLKDVANYGQQFRDTVLNVVTTAKQSFSNLQDYVSGLVESATSNSAVQLDFNPLTQQLDIKLDLSHSANPVYVPFGWDIEIGDLVDVVMSPNARLEITPEFSSKLNIGIDLSPAPDSVTPLSRFSIYEGEFQAKLVSTPRDVTGSARLGIFEVAIEDAAEQGLSGSVEVGVSVNLDNESGRIADLDVSPNIIGTANFDLPVQFKTTFSDIPLGELSLDFTWDDVTDPSTATLTGLEDVDFSAMAEASTIQHLISGLGRVVDFLRGVQDAPPLQTKLPVLNRSVADVIDIAGKLEAFHSELEANPPITIDELIRRLNIALESAATQVRFANDVLDFDFDYKISTKHHLDPIFDIDSLDVGLLSDFVDLNASAPLTVEVGAKAQLGLAIDLNDSATPYIKDTTGITIEAFLDSRNIEIDAAIAGLGAFIRNGRVQLFHDTNGNNTLDFDANGEPIDDNASWGIQLKPSSTGGRHKLSDIVNNMSEFLNFPVKGMLDSEFPVFLPTETNELDQPIVFKIPNLAEFGTTQFSSPDFAEEISNLDITDFMTSIIDGVDRVIGMLEDAFSSRIANKLPVIGDHLGDAAEFLNDLRTNFIQKLEEKIENGQVVTSELVREALVEAFGDEGIGWLRDMNNDGQKNELDIESATDRLEFRFQLEGNKSFVDHQLDLALDGLGLDLDGVVSLDVDFQLDVGFGVNAEKGFYLLTDKVDDPELQVELNAKLSDPDSNSIFQAGGKLGFLKIDVTDVPNSDGQYSHFTGAFTVDFKDPGTTPDARLTLGELISKPDKALEARLAAEAEVTFDLMASFNGNMNLPSLTTQFYLDWEVDTLSSTDETFDVGFRNIDFDVSQFMDGIVNPIKTIVEKALKPILPVIDVLTTPIPVLADLADKAGLPEDDFTLLGLAKTVLKVDIPPAFEEFVDFINIIRDGNLSAQAPTLPNIPDLEINGLEARDSRKEGKLKPENSSGEQQAEEEEEDQQTGFAFPIKDNPTELFKLILGQDTELVTFTLPKLDIPFEFEKFFPILGILGVEVKGEIGIRGNLSFGYDTLGIRQFAVGGFSDPGLILNGFYFSDTENADGSGKDIPELEVYGGAKAYAALDAKVVSAGVGGGLEASLVMDLRDPNEDGKLHLQELKGIFDQDQIFGRLFEIKGEVAGEFEAFVEVDLGLISARKEFEVTRKTLGSWTMAGPEEENIPVLGQVENGVLRLNAGPRAGERLFRNAVDEGENITINPGDAPGSVVVDFNGEYQQEFTDVQRIVVDSGQGDDRIVVNSLLDVEVEMRGGEGNDTLQGGLGKATLYGGAGDDVLHAGWRDSKLFGDSGNDTLFGDDGSDDLRGGFGDDEIHGGDGVDRIDGGYDNDDLYGDGGDDTITGSYGDDTIHGGQDDDEITGGFGDDNLHGDSGEDVIYGNQGDDKLFGDAGADSLFGEFGDDTLSGGSEADWLEGGLGADKLAGDNGNDQLFGGVGSDVLKGGTDDDLLEGGVGHDKLMGDAGEDVLRGGIGKDKLEGGANNDYLEGGHDADQLEGGTGGDTLLGEEGDDLLYGFGPGNQIQEDVDSLVGGSGVDTLYGGRGDDILRGEGGADEVYGEQGNDRIQYFAHQAGSTGNDTIEGNSGLDTIEILGSEEADHLVLSEVGVDSTGDQSIFQFLVLDPLSPDADNPLSTFVFTMASAPGQRDVEAVHVSGLGGDDHIAAEGILNINALSLDGGADNDTLHGSDGNDHLYGNDGDDRLFGHDGNDVLDGGAGQDFLFAGDGTNALQAGDTGDTLMGGTGTDFLTGGNGPDWIDAGGGIFGDIIHGAGGNDTLIGSDGPDTIYGYDDSGTIPEEDDDIILGGDGSDVIHGGPGSDLIVGEWGRDVLNGDSGIDELWAWINNDIREQLNAKVLSDFDPEVQHLFLLTPAPEITTQAEFDQLKSDNEQLVAILRADPATLSEQDRAIRDSNGDDVENVAATLEVQLASDLNLEQTVFTDSVIGGSGSDKLHASPFQDVLEGSADNDQIIDSPTNPFFMNDGTRIDGNADKVNGGSGSDTYFVHGTDQDDVIQVGLDAVSRVVVQSGGRTTVITGATASSEINRLNIEVAGVIAGDGNDTVTVDFGTNAGTEAGVHLEGGVGDDVLDAAGLQNHATLIGGSGDDLLLSGDGNDCLVGGAGNAVLRSDEKQNPGDATEATPNGVDVLIGGFGDDILSGGAGTDTIYGDTEYGSGSGYDLLVESIVENATLFGSTTSSSLIQKDVIDSLFSIEGAQLTGSDDANSISIAGSFLGDVTLQGGGGNDTLAGGDGNDLINGGSGQDVLTGRNGDDILIGGDDIDTIDEYSENDVVVRPGKLQARGMDTFTEVERITVTAGHSGIVMDASQAPFGITFQGGTGDDTMYGSAYDDSFTGSWGDDYLSGNYGNDTLAGDYGKDILRGGSGDDWLDDFSPGFTLSFVEDQLDYLYGGSGNDTIYGDSGKDYLYGEQGNDYLLAGPDSSYLSGYDGNDTVLGKYGNDTLYGGPGDDYLDGGTGNDSIMGDAGNDTIYGDYISYAPWSGGNDILRGGSGRDTIYGWGGNDTIYGNDDNDYLDGGYGNDWIYGDNHNDSLYGGHGDDYLFGLNGNDRLYGQSGNDHLEGNDGKDRLYGGSNNDRLYGGDGQDYLYGEDGSDRLDGGNDSTRDYLYGGDDADTFINYYYYMYIFRQWMRMDQDTLGDYDWDHGEEDRLYLYYR